MAFTKGINYRLNVISREVIETTRVTQFGTLNEGAWPVKGS